MRYALAAALMLLAAPAPAQTIGPLPVAPYGWSAPGAVIGVTVGTVSAQVLPAAGSRQVLALADQSANAPVACALGAPAVLNGAGSFTIAPGQVLTWGAGFVPPDAVNCIASAAATPLTVEVR